VFFPRIAGGENREGTRPIDRINLTSLERLKGNTGIRENNAVLETGLAVPHPLESGKAKRESGGVIKIQLQTKGGVHASCRRGFLKFFALDCGETDLGGNKRGRRRRRARLIRGTAGGESLWAGRIRGLRETWMQLGNGAYQQDQNLLQKRCHGPTRVFPLFNCGRKY